MPGIVQALAGIDLGKLSADLELTRDGVGAGGSATLAGLDPRDLLGDLGTLLKSVEDLPSHPEELVGALSGALGELGGVLKLPELGVIAEVAESFDQLVKLLEDAANQLGRTPGGSLLDTLLGDLGGLSRIVGDAIDGILDGFQIEPPEAAKVPLEALRALAGHPPASAAEVAELLSRVAVGVDLDALGAPAAQLGQFVARITAAGGDLDPIGVQLGALTVQVRAATALLVAAAPDVDGAVAALAPVAAALDQLTGETLPAAIDSLATDLAALDPGQLAERLLAAVDPLLALVPAVSFDLEEATIAPIRAVKAGVQGLTTEDVTAMLARVAAGVAAGGAAIGLDEVPRLIDQLFDLIVEELRRVPLRRLRDDLLDGLLGVEAQVRGFAGFALPHQLAERLHSVEDAIGSVDTGAVAAKVQELAGKINDLVKAVPIGDVANDLTAVVDQVGQLFADFTPAVKALADELDELAGQVEAVDFDQAGKAATDLISGIRGKITEVVGSGDVPEPAKVAIALAAQGLKQLDVSVEVRAPFDQALAAIDAEALLTPLQEGMGKVREVLAKVTPQALIDELEEPFSRLLGALDELKPAALVAGLTRQVGDLAGLIDRLDPRALVAPLEAEFQKLLAELRSAADPAPLLAPLKAAYAKLTELLDLLDPEKAVGELVGKLADLPNVVGEGLQGALTARAGGTAPPTIPPPGAFHLGDVLRPLALLLHQLRTVVTKLAEGLLGEALAALETPLALLRRLVDPAHGVLVEVADAVSQRARLVDLLADAGPAAELRTAIDALAVTAGTLELSASAQAKLGGAVASVQLDARIAGLADACAALDAKGTAVRDGVAAPELGAALIRLAAALDQLVPGPLLSPEPDAGVSARIGALFDAIDPTPLADELDQLGDAIQAKLVSFAKELTHGLFDIWNAAIGALDPVLPSGLIGRLHTGMERITAELAVLDPTTIETELDRILDAVIQGLAAFSPAAIAAELGGVIDAAKAKLASLDLKNLLGDLDPVETAIGELAKLRPSVVLQPLVADTEGLRKALEQLASLQLGQALIDAVAKLRAELDAVIDEVQQELDGLLDDLGAIDGQVSVSAGVSAG